MGTNKGTVLFLFFLISFASLAQVELKGVVKDSVAPIAYANVIIVDSLNNIKAYDISDENGNFIIDATKGKYILRISIIGYKEWSQEINLDSNKLIDKILLTPSFEELDEVVVLQRIPLIVQKPDRIIYNVDQSIAAKGGDAVDAIKTAPGVAFRNNNIEIIGRGNPRVMVNGVLLRLSGEQLMDFLSSISSEDIKSLEIITNPPAQYEASGGGGLINIIFKKGVRNSWKNSTSLAYTQARFSYHNLRNNFSLNKNRLNLNVGLQYTLGDREELEVIKTFYSSGLWNSDEEIRRPMDALSGNMLLDYSISERTTLGLQYFGNYAAPDRVSTIRTNRFDIMDNLESYLLNNGRENKNVTSHSYQIYSVTALDTLGKKLSFDIDYFDFDSKSIRNFVTEIFSNEDELIDFDQVAMNEGNQFINSFNAKVDVEYPLKNVDLSFGAQFTLTSTENEGLFFDTETGTPIFNPELSDLFDYQENVQAAYINGIKKINEKWQLQLGLRMENTQTEGNSRTLNEITEIDYFQFFPTFYLSHERNEENSYVLSYGRRIRRPSFRDLNPYRYFTNSFTYSVGNPFLQPSYSNDFDFGHSYKGALTSKLSARITTDGFGFIFFVNDDTNERITIRENYFTEYSFGISESYVFNKLSWWESQNSLNVFQYISVFDDIVNAEPKNGVDISLSTNNSFNIGEFSKVQLNFFYNFPFQRNLYEYGEIIALSLGFSHDFLDGDLRLSLYANDILNQAFTNNFISNVNGVEVNYTGNYTSRYFRASLSYDFGNKKIKSANRKSGNQDTERRSGG